jgi:hypothetical protein
VSAPLLTAALPGFRAWMLGDAGELIPYTGTVGAWEVGTTTAQCGRGKRHTAPDPDCTCGIYAFHTMHPQLRAEPVLGAIAAWGDMEIHRDGFRAQHATVLALAGRATTKLRAAARRYGVPVVPRAALLGLGTIATGALPPSLVDRADEGWLARRRGYADQLWVEASAGVVTIGVNPAATGAIALPGWVRGEVIERFDRPEPGTGRLALVVPSHWEEDCQRFHWGPAGLREMEAEVERDGEAAWEHLRSDRTPGPRSWRDLRALMEEWRNQTPPPRFASADEVYDEVAIPLGQALARDGSLKRLDVVLGLTLESPSARIVLDLRRGELHAGRGPTADLEATLSADDFLALVEGRFDLARESRTGRLRIRGSLAHALSCLAIVGAWARPHLGSAATHDSDRKSRHPRP